jgi:hypothetical protein
MHWEPIETAMPASHLLPETASETNWRPWSECCTRPGPSARMWSASGQPTIARESSAFDHGESIGDR